MTTLVKIKSDSLEGLEDRGIKLDPASIAQVLKRFVILGSEPGMLQRSDVHIHIPIGFTEGDDIPAKSLLDAGTSLFAALIYAGLDDRSGLTYKDVALPTIPWTTELISQYIFISFFYILTQNQAVGSIKTGANFINKTIGSTRTPSEIDSALFSSGMVKITHDWVIGIPLKDLGQASRNRLALGIAGYRQMQLFFSIAAKSETPPEYAAVWKVVKDSVNRGYFYGFHTNFRSEAFIRTFKSLNKTLLYVIHTYGVQADIDMAKSNRAMYKDTGKEARYSDVSMITEANFRKFETKPIFEE